MSNPKIVQCVDDLPAVNAATKKSVATAVAAEATARDTAIAAAVLAQAQGMCTMNAGAPNPIDTYVTPFAFDTTATTGGLYVWNGGAYVKVGLATT